MTDPDPRPLTCAEMAKLLDPGIPRNPHTPLARACAGYCLGLFIQQYGHFPYVRPERCDPRELPPHGEAYDQTDVEKCVERGVKEFAELLYGWRPEFKWSVNWNSHNGHFTIDVWEVF